MAEVQPIGLVSPVSRETLDRLKIYADLLRKWQAHINLVAEGTLAALERRHFADSLQLRSIAPEILRWVDLGSGAGFPGLVVAIDLAGQANTEIHLIESNGKKCAFLREVSRETGARAVIHHGRIEDVLPGLASPEPTILSARALAPLSVLIDLTHQMLKTPTRALFLKGQDIAAELTDSSKCWNLEYQLHQSSVDERGCIVEIYGATPRS